MSSDWILREMTLEQYVGRLPADHRARREYEELMSRLELAAEAAQERKEVRRDA